MQELNKSSRYLTYVFLFTAFCSCGDIFQTRTKIFEDYYLLQKEENNYFFIAYKIDNNSYIQKVPAKVIGYAVVLSNTFLVAEVTDEQRRAKNYYVIHLKNDDAFTNAVQILGEKEFQGWKDINRLTVKWILTK